MSRPLRVAVIIRHKPQLRYREDRIVGAWSYPVPQFEWDFIELGRSFVVNRNQFKAYDLVMLEDGLFGEFWGLGTPVIYNPIDSTADLAHYGDRLEQSTWADLVLVDHDQLDRFAAACPKVRRWSYAVNDHLFKDYKLAREFAVGYQCNIKGYGDGLRQHVRDELQKHCVKRGYAARLGPIADTPGYAQAFNCTQVSINVSRTPTNRPHRVFDCMASRGCLLTLTLPTVDGEPREPQYHYAEAHDVPTLCQMLDYLLGSGLWHEIADHGYELIHEHYTWAAKAQELRHIIEQELNV